MGHRIRVYYRHCLFLSPDSLYYSHSPYSGTIEGLGELGGGILVSPMIPSSDIARLAYG